MEYNRVEIEICGKKYFLQTDDKPSYVKEVARELNKRISDLLNENEKVSIVDAAVLVSLDILDREMKSNSTVDNIRMQIKTYVEEAAEARAQQQNLRRKLDEANKIIEKLKTDLEFNALRDNIK